jgi:hypothetical protein
VILLAVMLGGCALISVAVGLFGKAGPSPTSRIPVAATVTSDSPQPQEQEIVAEARELLAGKNVALNELRRIKDRLEAIPAAAPQYKQAQTLLADVRRRLPAGERVASDSLRERLRDSYQSTVAEANPHLNFVGSKITTIKGGYALWAVHEFFTQYTFSAGDDAHIVSRWIDDHRSDLKEANVIRVGVMGKGPYASYCWFDIK